MNSPRFKCVCAHSSLSSKLETITELQRHLEDSVRSGQGSHEGDTSKPASANTSYNTYYFVRGEEGDSPDGGGDSGTPRGSSTPKQSPAPKRPHQDLGAALEDALSQISALQSELQEVKQLNKRLQDQLGEEKSTSVSEKYHELEQEVDRLLAELDSEKERSLAEREQQQEEFDALQKQLRDTENKVIQLEQQLRSAMMRDATTSTDANTTEALQNEIEGLQQELDEAQATIAFQNAELSKLGVQTTPQKQDKATLASSSLPNLLTPETPLKTMSDSWTSPPRGTAMGERPDVRALREKHEEMTRLNQELQRKCHEQLNKTTPTHSRPSSAHSASNTSTTIQWQAKLREQEQALRAEMLERERNFLSQIRESETRYIEREAEWRASESALKRQVVELESRLSDAMRTTDNLRGKLAEALSEKRAKDEEILK